MRQTSAPSPFGLPPVFVHQKRKTLEHNLYTYFRLVGTLICALAFAGSINGQDIHFSQFYNAPFAVSPGLTGVFKEDVRGILNYRRQWGSIKQVNFETYSAAVDMKLWPYRPNSTGFFSFGLSVIRDQAGLSRLTSMNLGLHTSYTQKLSNNAFLTFGLRGAFNQRRFDLDDLLFPAQYNGGACPSCPNGLPRNILTTKTFFSLGAGFNLRLQDLNERALVDDLNHRSKVDIGFGISNLNRPDANFTENNPDRLPVGVTPYALSIIQLGKKSKFDLALNALAQVQKKSYEIVGMAGLKYHLSQYVDDRKAVQLGVAVRFSDNEIRNIDAVAPVLEFFVNEWRFGMNYDINVSDFKAATNGRGGPEFSVRYGFTKVKLPQPWHCRIL